MRGLDGGPDGDGRGHEDEEPEARLGGPTGPSGPGGPGGRRSGFGSSDSSSGFGFGGDDRCATGRRRPRRTVKAASVTATAGLVAVGLSLAACSTGGTGSRDEGAARTDEIAAAAPTPSAPGTAGLQYAERVDPIALLKADPKIGQRLKSDLKPCVADAYPVDASYGDLTNASAPDVVVNVMTCGDAVGIGTYVYRKQSDRYENVFMAEDAAVYATIDRGDLVVTKQVYAKGDPVAYPSGEDVITYRWSGNRFTQHDWVHNEYSRAVGDGDGAEPAPSASPAD
ncbi:hypothetical protein EDD98_1713 [Streptomyces sp. PanSC19]|uniref:hypothetical protein n=1 Tax=Streptomyces sp. PanSC19 TaxID=1520455 RepID=UPI000F478CAD|nr:hypothetical protein [Streptomyces sp. PanSC19]ROQ32717.1 hypothetical protein EDD98_1713 [Streptomyces sp. PanSC19]